MKRGLIVLFVCYFMAMFGHICGLENAEFVAVGMTASVVYRAFIDYIF